MITPRELEKKLIKLREERDKERKEFLNKSKREQIEDKISYYIDEILRLDTSMVEIPIYNNVFTAEEIADVLKEYGYRPKIKKFEFAKHGDPKAIVELWWKPVYYEIDKEKKYFVKKEIE